MASSSEWRKALTGEESTMLATIIEQLSRSVSLDEREKQRTKLEERLKVLDGQLVEFLNANSKSFFTALHAFFDVMEKIDDSKLKAMMLRNALVSCKTLLQCKRDHIRALWLESLEQKEMLRLLDKIEEIKKVPEQIEIHTASHHHVHAAQLVTETIRALETFEAVGALEDFSQRMIKKKEQMHTALIEELHNQVYLKDTWCDEPPEGGGGGGGGSRISTLLEDNFGDEELEKNPKARTPAYISYIVTALSILKPVEETVNIMKRRLKTELALLVDRAVAFTEDAMGPIDTSARAPAREETYNPQVLFMLITNVYDRMLRVLKIHMSIIRQLRKVKGGERALAMTDDIYGTYCEKDIWKAMQMELEVLICLYLDVSEDTHYAVLSAFETQENSQGEDSVMGVMDTANAFMDQKKVKRKAPVQLFSFANSQNAILDNAANLERALRQGAGDKFTRIPGMDDKYVGSAQGEHRVLCKKTDANITAVFKPTILFTDEALNLCPDLSGAFSQLKTFVNDFVRGSFLGNVRQELNSKAKGASEELERVVEKAVDKTTKMLLKSTWDMYNLVGYLCSLTFDLPHYATDFLSMLQSILIQYRGTCRLRYNSSLKSKQGPVSQIRKTGNVLAFEWLQDERVVKAVRSTPAWRELVPKKAFDYAMLEDEDDSGFPPLSEGDLLIELVGEKTVEKADISMELSTIKAVAHMHESMDWFASRVTMVANLMGSDPNKLAALWTDVGPVVEADADLAINEIKQHITVDMIKVLDTVAGEFSQLSENALLFLRIELRCHCLHYLIPMMRKSSHFIDIDGIETDPLVLSLNKDLITIDEALQSALQNKKREFLFHDLPGFISSIIIRNMKHIRRINEHGTKRMCRNIFALQQNLTAIMKTRASELDHAMQYCELLYLKAEDVLQGIVASGAAYTESEYKIILGLIAASAKVPDPEAHDKALQDLSSIFHELV